MCPFLFRYAKNSNTFKTQNHILYCFCQTRSHADSFLFFTVFIYSAIRYKITTNRRYAGVFMLYLGFLYGNMLGYLYFTQISLRRYARVFMLYSDFLYGDMPEYLCFIQVFFTAICWDIYVLLRYSLLCENHIQRPCLFFYVPYDVKGKVIA